MRREQWASDVADLQDFNPRTHEECDDRPALEKLIRDVFQSTHSRGVRLADHCLRRIAVIISIHALTRSATEQHFALDHNWSISIHALTRSATGRYGDTAMILQISIHALTRSATEKLGKRHENILISIHALTRSATKSVRFVVTSTSISIHALTRSATKKTCKSPPCVRFQSTHSRGVRQSTFAQRVGSV